MTIGAWHLSSLPQVLRSSTANVSTRLANRQPLRSLLQYSRLSLAVFLAAILLALPLIDARATIASSGDGSLEAIESGNSAQSAALPDADLESSSYTAAAAGQVALGVYRPIFPNDLTAVQRYDQAAANTTIVHWFAYWEGWKSEFSRSDLDQVSARGSVPLITWEPWAGVPNDPNWSLRSAILSGQNDAYIDSWARGLAAYDRPVLLRFAHEMHHQSYPWALGVNGNTAADYVAAWQHIHAIFARYDTSHVQWVWNPNTLGDSPASVYEPLYRSLYPGDEYVDWLGLDIYNTGPHLDWGAPYWRSFAQVLSQPYAALTALSDKPIILPEVGSTETGGSKAEWISAALTQDLLATYPRVRALVWFDIDKEENWTVESSRASRDGWIRSLQNSHFVIDFKHPIWGHGENQGSAGA